MANIRLGYSDQVKGGTLTANSETTGYEAVYAGSDFLGDKHRSSAVTDPQWVLVDRGATPDGVTMAVIYGHNIQSGATVELRSGATSAHGSSSLVGTFTWRAGTMVLVFASNTDRYVFFDFNDPTNPDGYIEVARLMLCPYFEPARNFNDWPEEVIDYSTLLEGDGGVFVGSARPEVRTVTPTFDCTTDAQWVLWKAWHEAVRTTNLFPIVKSPDDTDPSPDTWIARQVRGVGRPERNLLGNRTIQPHWIEASEGP